jgi:branched-subunit amino acid transport protein AzlD
MPSTGYLLAALTTILVVTFALRALPFAVLEPLRASTFMTFLARYMPVGVMVVLVVYTLKDVSLTTGWHGLPEAVALLVTVAVHLWRRNALLSIVVGTGLYVLLVNTVLA